MKNIRKIFTLLLTSLIAINLQAQPTENKSAASACKQLELECSSALKKADELINLYELQLDENRKLNSGLMSQIETQNKQILDLKYRPWYTEPVTVFLIGIITGGFLYEKSFNR